MTDSPRSPTPLRGSREKGGPSFRIERTAAPARACLEEGGAGVACALPSVCPGPPGSTCAGQSRRGQQPDRPRALPSSAADDARTAGVPWTAQRSHLHLLEGDHKLLARLVPLL